MAVDEVAAREAAAGWMVAERIVALRMVEMKVMYPHSSQVPWANPHAQSVPHHNTILRHCLGVPTVDEAAAECVDKTVPVRTEDGNGAA